MLDTAAVDQIVANVLKQLSAGGTAVPGREVRDERQEPATASGSPLSSLVTHLTDRIITGDLLAEKANGAKQIIIPAKAILTPTAHDFIKTHRVQVTRGGGAAAVSRSGEVSLTTWKLITVTSTPAVARLSGELGAGWSREILGCPDDAASLAISSICRGDAGGIVILSKQHFRAACRANRNDKVRAVSISSPAEVKTAREQLRLNVIAIDPTNLSYFELKNILGAFMKEER